MNIVYRLCVHWIKTSRSLCKIKLCGLLYIFSPSIQTTNDVFLFLFLNLNVIRYFFSLIVGEKILRLTLHLSNWPLIFWSKRMIIVACIQNTSAQWCVLWNWAIRFAIFVCAIAIILENTAAVDFLLFYYYFDNFGVSFSVGVEFRETIWLDWKVKYWFYKRKKRYFDSNDCFVLKFVMESSFISLHFLFFSAIENPHITNSELNGTLEIFNVIQWQNSPENSERAHPN